MHKFIRDVKEHAVCGILVSQNSGISTKNNFDIEIKTQEHRQHKWGVEQGEVNEL